MNNIKENIFWLLLGLISIGLVYAFFNMFLYGTSVIEVSNFYYLLGTGLTLICVLLWIAHVTRIQTLRSGTAHFIWLTLIAGILAAGVQFYQNNLSGNQSKLKIERFLILDESDATVEPSTINIKTYKKTRERSNIVFSQEDIKIFFIALVSGFSTDSSGNIDLSNEFMILNPSEGLADFGSLPKVTNIYHWKNKCSFKEKDVEKYFGNIIGKTIFPILLSDISNKVIAKGNLILRFKITDNKTNSIAEREIKLKII